VDNMEISDHRPTARKLIKKKIKGDNEENFM